MADQIDIASLEAQLTEAFVDLDFTLSEPRHKAFFNLCVQYCKLENRRIMQKRKQHNLFLTPQDILEYAVVTFIQNYGDRLWPFDSAMRSHINTTFTWDGPRINSQLGFFADVDQNCRNYGNNDRSLWQEKIRSPLGQKVKRYFQYLDRVPANLFPDLGEPTQESIEGWLRRVLDDRPQSTASSGPSPSALSSLAPTFPRQTSASSAITQGPFGRPSMSISPAPRLTGLGSTFGSQGGLNTMSPNHNPLRPTNTIPASRELSRLTLSPHYHPLGPWGPGDFGFSAIQNSMSPNYQPSGPTHSIYRSQRPSHPSISPNYSPLGLFRHMETGSTARLNSMSPNPGSSRPTGCGAHSHPSMCPHYNPLRPTNPVCPSHQPSHPSMSPDYHPLGPF